MSKSLFTLAVFVSALALPLSARADALDQFTFSFVTPPGYVSGDLTIDLPASPPLSPFTGFICTNCFVVLGDGYIFQFSQPAPGSTSVEFAQYSGFGPLPVPRAYLSFFAPEDLFTGSLTNPTFVTGTFDAEYRPFSTAPQFPGTITIEAVNTTVPEPSTFAMMATGILGAITTLRSRKTRVS
jgi:PEP-CTERM motif